MPNPVSTESLLARLVDRAERYPGEFSTWELDRIEEWNDGRTLSSPQVAVLSKIDMRTA